jgi:prepilin-type N-terminal cleavage/methylation domain-containing protein
MARHEAGYTLVELVVVILIFSIVMTLIAVSFNRIAASSAQIVRSAETDIGGLIGLELLRTDLELAGFGLPWSLPSGFSYSEGGCLVNCDQYTDAPGDVPRAVVAGAGAGLNGSDYLVLKGTALGSNAASRSWSYLNYTSNGVLIKPSRSEAELSPASGDRVIVLKTGGTGVANRELVARADQNFTLFLDQIRNLDAAVFRPNEPAGRYLVYDVAPPDTQTPGENLEFPFNRADYYLKIPASGVSTSCAHKDLSHGAGTLYKTVISHNSAVPTYYQLLDCVADLQVVFFLDTDGDGAGDYHTGAELLDKHYTASMLREQLKEIRVYILAQQGRRDPGYLYPVGDDNQAIFVGDPGPPALGRAWKRSDLDAKLGADWRNYHWKLYTISVRPKNL